MIEAIKNYLVKHDWALERSLVWVAVRVRPGMAHGKQQVRASVLIRERTDPPQGTEESAVESLETLLTRQLDLYGLHEPDLEVVDVRGTETARGMARQLEIAVSAVTRA